MKRFLSVVLAGIMILSFTGCAAKSGNSKSSTASSTAASASKASSVAASSKSNDDIIIVDDTSSVTSKSTVASSQSASTSQTTTPAKASGYCAVGTVNGSATAVILLENGEIKTVNIEGTKPVSGLVYEYSSKSDKYTFTKISFFPEFGISYKDWVFGCQSGVKNIYYGGDFNLNENSSVFIRYSATEWRVLSGSGMLKSDGISKGYIYSKGAVKGATNILSTAMVVGSCGDENALSPATKDNTKPFDAAGAGWDKGDKILK